MKFDDSSEEEHSSDKNKRKGGPIELLMIHTDVLEVHLLQVMLGAFVSSST